MKNRLVLCNSAILGATHIARKSRDTKPMLTQNNITYIKKKRQKGKKKPSFKIRVLYGYTEECKLAIIQKDLRYLTSKGVEVTIAVVP
jgi:hypothetical protein